MDERVLLAVGLAMGGMLLVRLIEVLATLPPGGLVWSSVLWQVIPVVVSSVVLLVAGAAITLRRDRL